MCCDQLCFSACAFDIMKLVLLVKWMALHSAVDGSSVYLHRSHSQVNDWYPIWARTFEIVLLLSLGVGTYEGSMIQKLCISHVCCLIFALYTYILLIFSFIRMQTGNCKWSMTQRSKFFRALIRDKRRALFSTTWNWRILCGCWRLVLHTYIHTSHCFFIGSCYFFMYHRTIWMKRAYPIRFDCEAAMAPKLVLSVWWSENYLTLPWKEADWDSGVIVVECTKSGPHCGSHNNQFSTYVVTIATLLSWPTWHMYEGRIS
jgi:hypothetical protein